MKKHRQPWIALAVAFCTVALAGCGGQPTVGMLQTGDRQMRVGDYVSAVKSYESVPAEEAEGKEQVPLRLATAQIKLGHHREALDALEKASEPSLQAAYLRAVCHLGLNDVAGAEASVEQALQVKPDDSLALGLLGRVRFLQKQYVHSATAYRRALASSSDESVRTSLYYNLAMAEMLAGQLAAADESFQQYLVRQKYVTAVDNRAAGAIAYAVGDRDRALRHWQRLNGNEKQQILNAIAEEAETYGALATAR